MSTHAERPLTSWERRDLPFLRAAAQVMDATGRVFDAQQFADAAGLSPEEAMIAGAALIEADYLDGHVTRGYGAFARVTLTMLTERGRRTAGLWPAEDSAEAFEAGLLEVAARTKDPEQAGRLRRIAREVAGMTRELAIEVGAAAISRSTFGG
jgi:hypothetical protein